MVPESPFVLNDVGRCDMLRAPPADSVVASPMPNIVRRTCVQFKRERQVFKPGVIHVERDVRKYLTVRQLPARQRRQRRNPRSEERKRRERQEQHSDLLLHIHFDSVSFVSLSVSSFAISGGNSPNASITFLRTS